jgi:mannose-1-phosphate guanylyltransferase/mannose-6-phosphate isomerase
MPSDHLIQQPEAFLNAVGAAAPLAQDGWIMTFGIRPTRPDTGFGYIRRGSPLDHRAFEADQFVEKPDLATALSYVSSGEYSWNAGSS